jgi:hypothetical protein
MAAHSPLLALVITPLKIRLRTSLKRSVRCRWQL